MASSKWSSSLSAVDLKQRSTAKSVDHQTPATFTQRLAAWTWDALIFQIITHALAAVFLDVPTSEQMIERPDLAASALLSIFVFALVALMAWVLYHTVCETFFGTTLGKHLLGLRVDLGAPIDFDKNLSSQLKNIWRRWRLANARFAASIFSWISLNVGHLLALKRADKKMLHDLMSNTSVIHDPNHAFFNWLPLSSIAHARWRIAALVAQVVIFIVFNVALVMALLSVMAMTSNLSAV